MIDRKWYTGLLGMSCVENHVLAFLLSRGEDIRCLYADSTPPLETLFQAAVGRGIRFTDGCGIARIQERLKSMGIIDLRLTDGADTDRLLHAADRISPQETVLMETSSDFARRYLAAKGWREDHVVLLEREGERWRIVNDLPPKALFISHGELKQAFSGRYFLLKVRRRILPGDRERLWQNRRYRPECFGPAAISPSALSGVPDVWDRMRQCLMAYKISRKRTAEYYGEKVDTAFIGQAVTEFERLQARVEYSFLKHTTTAEQLAGFLRQLTEWDTTVIMELKKRLIAGGFGTRE